MSARRRSAAGRAPRRAAPPSDVMLGTAGRHLRERIRREAAGWDETPIGTVLRPAYEIDEVGDDGVVRRVVLRDADLVHGPAREPGQGDVWGPLDALARAMPAAALGRVARDAAGFDDTVASVRERELRPPLPAAPDWDVAFEFPEDLQEVVVEAIERGRQQAPALEDLPLADEWDFNAAHAEIAEGVAAGLREADALEDDGAEPAAVQLVAAAVRESGEVLRNQYARRYLARSAERRRDRRAALAARLMLRGGQGYVPPLRTLLEGLYADSRAWAAAPEAAAAQMRAQGAPDEVVAGVEARRALDETINERLERAWGQSASFWATGLARLRASPPDEHPGPPLPRGPPPGGAGGGSGLAV
jgi:hypothetical protein